MKGKLASLGSGIYFGERLGGAGQGTEANFMLSCHLHEASTSLVLEDTPQWPSLPCRSVPTVIEVNTLSVAVLKERAWIL